MSDNLSKRKIPPINLSRRLSPKFFTSLLLSSLLRTARAKLWGIVKKTNFHEPDEQIHSSRGTAYALVVRSFDVSSTSAAKTGLVYTPECRVPRKYFSRADHSRKTCNGNDQTTSRPNGSPNKDKSLSTPLIPLMMAIEILSETSRLSMTTSTRRKSRGMINSCVHDENANRKSLIRRHLRIL